MSLLSNGFKPECIEHRTARFSKVKVGYYHKVDSNNKVDTVWLFFPRSGANIRDWVPGVFNVIGTPKVPPSGAWIVYSIHPIHIGKRLT